MTEAVGMQPKLTGKQVEGVLYSLCVGSPLAEAVNGRVYRCGQRPRGSRAEDVVVGFLSGAAGVPQRGTAQVLVFVPDVPSPGGYLVEDARRTSELEAAAAEFARSIAGALGYHWTLDEPVHTEDDPEIGQHIVVIKLNYKFL